MPPTLNLEQAKKAVITAIGAGATVEQAMAGVGRAYKTYEGWRAKDREFAAAVDEARKRGQLDAANGVRPEVRNIDFVTFRKEYLGYETYAHQMQWIDVLEGREPTPIEGCEWDPRNNKRLIINVPPGHSKSSTVTVDWVTYKICMNPNVRVCIISKKQEQARKFLYQIKQRLTSNLFAKLQAAYAPKGGFRPERGAGTFAANTIYIAGRDVDAKDPTVEVLGIGGQVYGSRYDVIIVDDAVVGSNASEYEKQIEWLESEVENRLKNGTLVLIGTRLRSVDLYGELRRNDRYLSGRSPWSLLRQPMVLKYADDPKDWVTLWPRSSTPFDEASEPEEDGTYVMWDGPACARVRDSKPPAVWSLVYQQQQVADDAVFNPTAVLGSVNKRRRPGILRAGALAHPREGIEGKWVVASMDPAMTGDTFTLVGAVDRRDNRRYIMNAWVRPSPTPTYIRDLIKEVTEEYGVNEWVIEQNAFQLFLIHDPEIQQFLATRGVKLTPHYTSRNKQDPSFGVASLAPLFGNVRRTESGGRFMHEGGSNLLELPDPDYSEGIKALIEQLVTWEPGRLGKELKQDGPMALWFFELRCRALLGYGQATTQTSYMKNPYLSRSDRRRRVIVPMQEYTA